MSVTLGEFFSAFNVSWKSDHTRPQPIVLDVMYDWDMYYDNHINRVSCFNKTRDSQSYCRAFLFTKNSAGIVQMQVKGSPSDNLWYGEGGIHYNPGFTIIRTTPQTAPQTLPPMDSSLPAHLLSNLNSSSIRNFCEVNGLLDSHTWLMEFARTGRIPVRGAVSVEQIPDNKYMMKGWDYVGFVGVEPRMEKVPFIRQVVENKTHAAFWSIPVEGTHFEILIQWCNRILPVLLFVIRRIVRPLRVPQRGSSRTQSKTRVTLGRIVSVRRMTSRQKTQMSPKLSG